MANFSKNRHISDVELNQGVCSFFHRSLFSNKKKFNDRVSRTRSFLICSRVGIIAFCLRWHVDFVECHIML